MTRWPVLALAAFLLAAVGLAAAVLGGGVWGGGRLGGGAWRFLMAGEPPAAAAANGAFPLPPFPPRFDGGPDYDKCLAAVDDDAETAATLAAAMLAAGGGDPARHCQALAAIANGEAEAGAVALEALARSARTPERLRAVLFGQASEARLEADQAERALADSNEAVARAPDDPGLLVGRAHVYDALDRTAQAMDDLNRALLLESNQSGALLLRASLWRQMDMLAEALSDIDKALALDPGDAEAWLERGTIRHLMGDRDGARRDWKKAQETDPNSEAAELAAQNLTLLDTGQEQK